MDFSKAGGPGTTVGKKGKKRHKWTLGMSKEQKKVNFGIGQVRTHLEADSGNRDWGVEAGCRVKTAFHFPERHVVKIQDTNRKKNPGERRPVVKTPGGRGIRGVGRT